MKTCTKCNQTLPIKNFNRRTQRYPVQSGEFRRCYYYRSVCKSCYNIETAKHTAIRRTQDPIFKRYTILKCMQGLKKRNDESRKTATNHKVPWSSEDIDALHNNIDKSDQELATLMGRTREAIRAKRKRMGIGKKYLQQTKVYNV